MYVSNSRKEECMIKEVPVLPYSTVPNHGTESKIVIFKSANFVGENNSYNTVSTKPLCNVPIEVAFPVEVAYHNDSFQETA